MTVIGSTVDLVDQAARRARLAALLGRLLVCEPGPDLAPLVAGVDELAPLASGDGVLDADYERLLLREVPVYESAFLGDDGQRGGPISAAVAAVYAATGFDETDQWRVAGPDHLGLELRYYAHLCAEEAAGWESDRPDRATRAVDAAREFLALHLGGWGEVAMEAVRRRSGDSPYAAVADAVSAFLAAEAERLRPEPDHPGLPPVDVGNAPPRLGPARLARWLLSPACSGAFLDADDLAAGALALGIPWRASDPRSRFRQVLEDAIDGDDLDALLDSVRRPIERWRTFHAEREATRDGDRRMWRAWRLRSEQTLRLLDRGPGTFKANGVADAVRELLADTVDRLQPLDHPLADDARRALTDLIERKKVE